MTLERESLSEFCRSDRGRGNTGQDARWEKTSLMVCRGLGRGLAGRLFGSRVSIRDGELVGLIGGERL